jgi:hypothetical protein
VQRPAVVLVARFRRKIVFPDLFWRDGNAPEDEFNRGIKMAAKFPFDRDVDGGLSSARTSMICCSSCRIWALERRRRFIRPA